MQIVGFKEWHCKNNSDGNYYWNITTKSWEQHSLVLHEAYIQVSHHWLRLNSQNFSEWFWKQSFKTFIPICVALVLSRVMLKLHTAWICPELRSDSDTVKHLTPGEERPLQVKHKISALISKPVHFICLLFES